MPRVEPFQTNAAARPRHVAPSGGGAASSASFSLPELTKQAASRRPARPAAAVARNERPPARIAREQVPGRPDRPERPESGGRSDRPPRPAAPEQPQRRTEAKRAEDDRDGTSKAAKADDGPAAPDRAQPQDKPDSSPQAGSPDRDTEAVQAALPEGQSAAQPGSAMAAMIGLAAGADTSAQTQAGAGGASGGSRLAKVSGPGSVRSGAGQGSTGASAGKGADEADAEAKAEGDAKGERPTGTVEQGSIPGLVGRIAGKHAEGKGERGGSGESKLLDLFGQATEPAPAGTGPAGRPAFADLLGQVPGGEANPKAAVQRTVLTDVAVGRVPIEIGLKSLDGSSHFEIRLSPDELGRVDVRLDIDDAGQVKAHLVVERPEALALLTRDRGQLEHAFEQAGLRPTEGSIAFSLRDGSADPGGRGMQNGNERPGGQRGPASGVDEIAPASNAAALPRAILSRLGALDLRI